MALSNWIGWPHRRSPGRRGQKGAKPMHHRRPRLEALEGRVALSVTADDTVQGQGHETVLSQIVADQLGLRPGDVDVTLEMDTAKDQWSIAAGTYSCRFTPGTAVAAQMAAARMADKLKDIGAKQLNVLPDDVELAQGKTAPPAGHPDQGDKLSQLGPASPYAPRGPRRPATMGVLLGNRDFTIFVECQNDRAVVYPGGRSFDMNQASENELAQYVQQLIQRRQATVRAGEPRQPHMASPNGDNGHTSSVESEAAARDH